MSKIMSKIYFKGLSAIAWAKAALKDERGETNIIAIIIILAIVIALAIIFRNQIAALFNKIWSSLFDNVDNAIS